MFHYHFRRTKGFVGAQCEDSLDKTCKMFNDMHQFGAGFHGGSIVDTIKSDHASFDSCSPLASPRIDCGYAGMLQDECEFKGCCW